MNYFLAGQKYTISLEFHTLNMYIFGSFVYNVFVFIYLGSFLNHVRTFSTWDCAGSFSEIVAQLPPTSMLEEPHIVDTFLYCVVMFTLRGQVH